MATLRDAVKAHIESQSCTLYGRAFDIVRSDSREACIDWLMTEIDSILDRHAKMMIEGKIRTNGSINPDSG